VERNRLIDGWRGVSVALVVIGHLIGVRYQEYFDIKAFRMFMADQNFHVLGVAQQVALRLLAPLPNLGVSIFFIISGYLITSLLLKEESSRGRISLGAFYVRRVCRIVPAFLIYLATIWTLSKYEVIAVPREAFIRSGLFLCDIPETSCTWWLAHTWSLSVEEQYYLTWPFLLIVLTKWRTVGLSLLLATLISASFVFTLAIHFAYIAIGGLYALSPRARHVVDWFAKTPYMIMFAVVIFVQPFFASIAFAHHLIDAVQPFFLAVVFFGTISGRGPFLRLVSRAWLQRLGLVSYSIYLWQQLSTAAPASHGGSPALYLPFLFVVPALLSYWMIEKPLVACGHYLSNIIKARSKPFVLPSEKSSARCVGRSQRLSGS
jgi:peptidoglycan/LPS O-acetylase OafA/YrhL